MSPHVPSTADWVRWLARPVGFLGLSCLGTLGH
jgi:hypothetical protein